MYTKVFCFFSNRQDVNFAKLLIDTNMLFSIRQVYFPKNFVYTKEPFFFSTSNLINFDLYTYNVISVKNLSLLNISFYLLDIM